MKSLRGERGCWPDSNDDCQPVFGQEKAKMDASAWLALMSKANQVFGGPGIFLSFPALTPISCKPQDLDFARALVNPEAAHAMADLSLNVNSLPTGTLFQGPGDTFLWSAYDQWVKDMVLAKDQMTTDERAQYDQANALLTIKDANGFLADSPMVVEYKQYRDAWFSAAQNYKNEQITCGSSSDPEVQTQWNSVEEPRLRALVDQANSDWENKGHKAEVENAQAVKARLEANSPSNAWTEWSSSMIKDLDLPTDAVSNMPYAPTMFSPLDLFTQDWPTFHLSKDEIVHLSESANQELRNIFSGSAGDSILTSLSFEFRSAALVRPWLNTAMFNARFWKFREGIPPLSDGAVPPNGSWPAYVSALVFARHIQMTTQTASQPQPLRALPAINPAILRQPPLLRPIRMLEPTKPMLRTGRPVAVAPLVTSVPATAAGTRTAPASLAKRMMIATYHSLTVSRRASALYGTSSAGSSPQPTSSTANGDVSIVAFICRRLPQTPNPDLSLNWGP